MYGIGYVWNPVRWLELYAAYKVHQLDLVLAAAWKTSRSARIGTRIRF